MSEIVTIISNLQQAYHIAVYDKDVENLLRLYDTNVRVFDAWGVWQHEGVEAWRKAVEGWFSSLGGERVAVTFEDTRAAGPPEGGFASMTATYTAVSATGEKLRSMQNRMTWGIGRSGGSAVIVHEHTSAPISFGDMKAMLQKPAET